MKEPSGSRNSLGRAARFAAAASKVMANGNVAQEGAATT
jgi:hypothetical protein